MIKISVIIRAYNTEETISRAIQSAVSQDFSNDSFEILVINDGSLDNTGNILKKFEGLSFIKIINQKNKGAVRSANIGFKKARGDYVVLLDGDDEFAKGAVQKMLYAISNDRAIDYVYPDYYENDGYKHKRVCPPNEFETIAGGIMIKRVSLEREGFYREDLVFPEYDIFLKTLGRWKSCHLHEPLYVYNRVPASITKNFENVNRGILQLEKLHASKLEYIRKIRKY